MWLVVTGTGRCGTGYIAHVLKSAGVRCGHEGIFDWRGWDYARGQIEALASHPKWDVVADSSWLATPWLDKPELLPITKVHLVRHPKKVIDSHIRIQNWKIPEPPGVYHEFLREHIPEAYNFESDIDKSAYFYIEWNKRIEPHAHVFHRVEDDVEILLEKLDIDYEGKELFDDKKYNARGVLTNIDISLDEISEPLQTQIKEMAVRYGYTI